MSESLQLQNILEAALFAAGKPLSLAELAQLFDESARPNNAELRAALTALQEAYAARAIELVETASGYRMRVRAQFATDVARLWPERPQRYSRALLETLALIAYRQPITRAEIEGVRGVAVNPNIIKTLIDRDWVRVVGHRDVPGHPELLGTTREFLDHFGLRSVDELPPLAELKAMPDLPVQMDLPVAAGGDAELPRDQDDPVARAPAAPLNLSSDDDLTDDAADDAADEPEHLASGEQASGLVAAGPDRDD
jgi:segregation and condensation protein B